MRRLVNSLIRRYVYSSWGTRRFGLKRRQISKSSFVRTWGIYAKHGTERSSFQNEKSQKNQRYIIKYWKQLYAFKIMLSAMKQLL